MTRPFAICLVAPPGVVPVPGATDVPTNATLTSFSGYTGRYEVVGTDHAKAITTSDADPAHTVHFAMPPLPPRTAIQVTWGDGEFVTAFTTGGTPDHAPPPRPQVGEVSVTVDAAGAQLSLPVASSTDTVALVVTVDGHSMRLAPSGVAGDVPTDCHLFSFTAGHEACFHVTAVDIADNASPEVVTCTTVTERADPPPVPQHRPADPSSFLAVLLWFGLAALFAGIYLWRGRLVRARYAPGTWSVPADRVMQIAHRIRTMALAATLFAILAAGAASTLASWYGSLPAALVPACLANALRGHRIRSLLRRGGYAMADGEGRVYVLLGPTVRNWLVARPDAFAPDVPAARVHRD